ncbi:MAG: histidinol phosphate phosphatase domain-containing protein [Candidatus Omnitrophica bacterium]|nr:histidinol phosphate phosphatase domain-containing protein [Candidatus Omnitrophota bacterium]
MYDLHIHSLLSDGVLLPSGIAVRYMALGFKAIAITDHCDYSNVKANTAAILEFTAHWPNNSGIKVLPGIELTHLPVEQFSPLTKYCRRQGIKVIVAHGQTLAEPVIKNTNRAALEADIDILAHPGLISDEDARLAKKNNIFLEVTCRRGHKVTNVHVIEKALKAGAKLILNTDSHTPEDIISPQEMVKTARHSGLSISQIDKIYRDVAVFLKSRGKI